MNKNELRDAFSKVQASDGLMQAVLLTEDNQKPRTNSWRIARRVAGCAAVLALLIGTMFFWPVEENYVTGPGMIKVYAHEMDDTGNEIIESVILEKGVVFTPNVRYDSSTSIVEHFPFTFVVDESLYPNMEITIEVMTDAGVLYTDRKSVDAPTISPNMPAVMQLFLVYSGQRFITDIDTNVYWQPYGFDYDHMAKEIKKGNYDFDSAYKPFNYEKTPSFIDVIFRADDLVVGYCVIEIRETNGAVGYEAEAFSFKVLTIVSFPKVDGKLQKVSEKYVKEQIQLVHDYA